MKQQAVLIASLAFVGALLGLANFWTAPAPSEDDGLVTTGLTFPRDEVVQIAIERESDKIELIRTENGWNIETPLADRGSPFVVDKLLDALEKVERGKLIPDGIGVELGTEPQPAALVTVSNERGETTRFSVGDRAPVGWQAYLKTSEGTHFAVPGAIFVEITRATDDFRRREVFDFDMGAVTRVVLESREGVLDIAKDADGVWRLLGYSRVDLDRLEDLLIALYRLNFEQFYHAELQQIDEPHYTVTVFAGDNSQRLVVGELTSLGRLSIDDIGRVGFLPVEPSAFLKMGPTDIGLRSLLSEGNGLEQSFKIRYDSQERSGSLVHGEWVSDASDWDVDRCVEQLGSLALVYRRDAPSHSDNVLGRVEVLSESGRSDWLITELDDDYVTVREDKSVGGLRLSRDDLAKFLDACQIKGEN